MGKWITSLILIVALSASTAMASGTSKSTSADPTSITITRIDELAKEISAFGNRLGLTPREQRAEIFAETAPIIEAAISSLKGDIAANYLEGTVYENILLSQCPKALDEIRTLYLN